MDKKDAITYRNPIPSPSGRGSLPYRQAGVGLKICGMKHNIMEVAALQPDYLGFIFWEPSERYFDGIMPELPDSIKKVGVFVDATISEVMDKVEQYNLNLVQLHGDESPEYCNTLKRQFNVISNERGKSREIPQSQSSFRNDIRCKIIKVFSIKDTFDFSVLQPYETACDYYLFDTKGKLPGGNGYTFDWSALKEYPSAKPYFLSGGIGPGERDSILSFLQQPEAKHCHALDVNSRFETTPGLKDIEKLKKFKSNVIAGSKTIK